MKLKNFTAAVTNIENAVKWSVVEYKDKLAQRKQRRIEKEIRIRGEIERGEISPVNLAL